MKKFLRKVISGLVLLIVIMVIGCGKQITEIKSSCVETSEETTPTEEESVSTQTETETSEEPTEEETIEEEILEEETSEETPEPERYFTYKVKYEERYPQAVLITDETFPESLRVTLSDNLPESFFEETDCKSSEECFNDVIKEILLSLEGKEIILRDTQRGLPKFSVVDTTKPVEVIFKFVQTKEEETGPLFLPIWDKEQGIPCVSYAFVQRPDGGLRFIVYYSPKFLEDTLSIPRRRYGVSIDFYRLPFILKFHPEILERGKILPDKPQPGETKPFPSPSEEEYNFYRKIWEWRGLPGDLPPLGILFLKGEK